MDCLASFRLRLLPSWKFCPAGSYLFQWCVSPNTPVDREEARNEFSFGKFQRDAKSSAQAL